jgi:hypothetical protein
MNTTGTSPGLSPKSEEAPNVVSMRCKGNGCDSTEVTEIKVEGPAHIGQRVYRCVKCGRVENIAVGGAFVL